MYKKIILLLFIFLMVISAKAFSNVTYSAKSTVKQQNKQDVIKLDVMPIIKVNSHEAGVINNDPTMYVAPLISPASQQERPTLNFNLNNIKNAKKGAILPNDNVNKTITSVVQYFGSPYDKVFSHLIGVIEASGLELVSYDSQSGKIFTNYKHEKPIYITVSKYNSYNVMVKITPADGVYDIPATITDKIFTNLSESLAEK